MIADILILIAVACLYAQVSIMSRRQVLNRAEIEALHRRLDGRK